MNLLGFSGAMGSGKSTAIEVLRTLMDNRSTDVVLVKFAQPLYDMQEFIYEQIESVYRRPVDFKKDRKLLQWLGTDWGRDTISESLWVDIFTAKAKTVASISPKTLIVCDDVRFDNEGQTIKKLGGKLIKLETSRNGERIDIRSGINNHKSESGVSPEFIDLIVENNSTMHGFQNSLYEAYKELGIL